MVYYYYWLSQVQPTWLNALGSISLSKGLLYSCLFTMFISNLFDFLDHKLVGL